MCCYMLVCVVIFCHMWAYVFTCRYMLTLMLLYVLICGYMFNMFVSICSSPYDVTYTHLCKVSYGQIIKYIYIYMCVYLGEIHVYTFAQMWCSDPAFFHRVWHTADAWFSKLLAKSADWGTACRSYGCRVWSVDCLLLVGVCFQPFSILTGSPAPHQSEGHIWIVRFLGWPTFTK